jgi:hypothetical protein
LASTGCGDDEAAPPDAGQPSLDAAVSPDAGPTYEDADWLFEPDRLLSIDIEITAENWDSIRFQSRNIIEIFGEDCGSKPSYSPFTYVVANVTVEGERVEQVGVRKKGFLGSLDDVKPSLKIKFDEYVANQHLSGLTRLTLNNGKQDPSYLDQCLGFQLFAQAGVPAPRCNFAEVSINGESLGIYVNVESVKKPFLGRHFDNIDGNLYEGTLSDFRDGWTATFERKTNKSNPPGSEDTSDIDAVVDALALGDAAMLAEIEQLIDVEEFFSFWAVETMVSHWDGYAGNNNNFFLYGDPTTGKFAFMPWGVDQLFGDGGENGPSVTRSALTRRLYLYGPSRERYLARFEQILDDVFDDAALLAEIDRMEALISPSIPAAELVEFGESVALLRALIDGREQRLRNALAIAGPGEADLLSAPLCFVDVGTLTATFTTEYGGGGIPELTLDITIDGTPLTLSNLNGVCGPDDAPDRSVLYLVAETAPTKSVIAFVTLPDSQVSVGPIDVGAGLVEAAIVFRTEGVEEADAVYFLSGTMTLTSGAASPGSVWTGDLDTRLWNPPWF